MVVAVVALLAGCGDDDGEDGADATTTTAAGSATSAGTGDTDRDAYVSALAEPLASGAAGLALGDEAAQCVAGAVVDAIGADRLADAGVEPDGFGDAEDLGSLGVDVAEDSIESMGEGLAACGIAEQIEGLLVASYASDSGGPLSETGTTCVTDAIDDEALADAVARGFVDAQSEGPFQLVPAAVGACPEATVELLVNGFQQLRELGPSEVECMRALVAAEPELAAQAFSTDVVVSEEFGRALLAACPSLAAG